MFAFLTKLLLIARSRLKSRTRLEAGATKWAKSLVIVGAPNHGDEGEHEAGCIHGLG
jgi:hypothetical protein